jgi:hypothetical protein
MKGKIMLLTGGAVGYVLGTRAGRERYEQIATQARGLWNNPKVQEKAARAQDLAKDKAPVIKDKVAGAASSASAAAKDKVGRSGSSDGGEGTVGSSGSQGWQGGDTEVVVDVVEVEPAPYPSTGV